MCIALADLIDIPDYVDRYKICSCGIVYSCRDSSQYKQLNPTLTSNGYYVVSLYKNGKAKRFYVHRLVYSALVKPISKDLQIDHVNGDKTNNTLANLRIATAFQNHHNSKPFYNRKFKGAIRRDRSNDWESQIKVNNKIIYLGRFKTELEAAIAYDLAAIKYHGEFARTNLIQTADALERSQSCQ